MSNIEEEAVRKAIVSETKKDDIVKKSVGKAIQSTEGIKDKEAKLKAVLFELQQDLLDYVDLDAETREKVNNLFAIQLRLLNVAEDVGEIEGKSVAYFTLPNETIDDRDQIPPQEMTFTKHDARNIFQTLLDLSEDLKEGDERLTTKRFLTKNIYTLNNLPPNTVVRLSREVSALLTNYTRLILPEVLGEKQAIFQEKWNKAMRILKEDYKELFELNP